MPCKKINNRYTDLVTAQYFTLCLHSLLHVFFCFFQDLSAFSVDKDRIRLTTPESAFQNTSAMGAKDPNDVTDTCSPTTSLVQYRRVPPPSALIQVRRCYLLDLFFFSCFIHAMLDLLIFFHFKNIGRTYPGRLRKHVLVEANEIPSSIR